MAEPSKFGGASGFKVDPNALPGTATPNKNAPGTPTPSKPGGGYGTVNSSTDGVQAPPKTAQQVNQEGAAAGLKLQMDNANAYAGTFGAKGEALKTAQIAQMRALQRKNAGTAAAGQYRRGGGGADLASMRQSALDRGIAEGELGAAFLGQQASLDEMQRIAMERSGKASTDFYTESEKLRQAGVSQGKAANAMRDEIGAEFKLMDDATYVTTDADLANFAAKMEAKYAAAAAADPAIRAELDKIKAMIIGGDEGEFDI